MKTAYTYTLLRYVHDVASGEFANVGVVLVGKVDQLTSLVSELDTLLASACAKGIALVEALVSELTSQN